MPGSSSSDRSDPNRRTVVVLAATRHEILHIVDVLGDVEVCHVNGRDEWHSRTGPVDVVVLCSGIGMVCAAAMTESGILRFAPDWIVNYGSAGAHVRDVVPGDVVIGERTVAYATMQVLPDGQELHIGQRFTLGIDPLVSSSSIVDCDRMLQDMVVNLAKGWTPAAWPAEFHYAFQPERQPMVRSGVVISADMWIQSPVRIDYLHLRHGSLCADMEAAAVAQVASMHGVPFITIKDISNNEFYESTNIQYGQVLVPINEIGRRSSVLVAGLIDRLGEAS